MREIIPGLRRVAVMADVGYAASVLEMNQVEATARKLGLEVDKLEIRRAEDIVAAVEALKSEEGQQHLPGDEAWLIGEHRMSGEWCHHAHA